MHASEQQHRRGRFMSVAADIEREPSQTSNPLVFAREIASVEKPKLARR